MKKVLTEEQLKKKKEYHRKYNKIRRTTKKYKEWEKEYKKNYIPSYIDKKEAEAIRKSGISLQTYNSRLYRKKNPNYKKLHNRKKKADPVYRMHEVLRSYISRSIKGKIKKSNQAKDILGITLEEFKDYIEKKFKPGMTWDNYGEWHLDHIKPIKEFDLKIKGELEKCFYYTNFQPLWALDNYKKGSKWQN